MTTLIIDDLPYHPDSESLMRRLAVLPDLVILDSSNSAEGRFDILSALPLARYSRDALRMQPGDVAHAGDDVFAAMEKLIAPFRRKGVAEAQLAELPFQGGLIGYLGYPVLTERGAYKIVDAYFGVYCWAVIVDHQQCRCRLFFLPSCPRATRERVFSALEQPCPAREELHLPEVTPDTSRHQYQQAFERIREYILAGDCYQVNLTQRFTAPFSGSALSAYLRLRQTGRNPFSGYLQSGDRALLTFSPERFLQLRNQEVVTQPVKGTRPRSSDPVRDRNLAEELLASDKDRAENVMIVDLLRNDLGAVCETGSVVAGKLFDLQSFNNVHHLVSTVTGRLPRGKSAVDLLRSCFPGGSITGAPKLRAMEIIEEVEWHPRSVYCGSVFYLGFNGDMDSNITIRTLLAEQGRIHCWAGGGIVADSEADREYTECFDKIQWIINALKA
ncbi:MAG: aminodeoxychorismate synthase component I [Pseudohongiellaceae bacterium]